MSAFNRVVRDLVGLATSGVLAVATGCAWPTAPSDRVEIRAIIAVWIDFDQEWILVVDYLKTPCHGDVTVRAVNRGDTVWLSAHAPRAGGCTEADLFLEGDGGFEHPTLYRGLTLRGLQPDGSTLDLVVSGYRAEVCSERDFTGC